MSGVPPVHSVVLVGFMGSGKSVVGAIVARELGWEFLDLDDMVEARVGRSIEAVFEDEGEQRFRELESQVGREALSQTRRVIASGGGWAVPRGRLEELPGGVLSVWLRVTPETAVARAGSDSGSERVRPLLSVDDPVARARALLRERTPRYEVADVHLDAEEVSPDALAERIVSAVRASLEATNAHEAHGHPRTAANGS